jgi:hypothetical protein
VLLMQQHGEQGHGLLFVLALLLLLAWPTAACWSTLPVQLLCGNVAVVYTSECSGVSVGFGLWRDLA